MASGSFLFVAFFGHMGICLYNTESDVIRLQETQRPKEKTLTITTIPQKHLRGITQIIHNLHFVDRYELRHPCGQFPPFGIFCMGVCFFFCVFNWDRMIDGKC